MSGDCQWPEGAQVASVFQGEQGERDKYQENGFLVYVPAEEEGGIGAERESGDEGVPGWREEEFN